MRLVTRPMHQRGVNEKDQCTYKRNTVTRWRNQYCHGKVKELHILSVCLQPYLVSTQSACAVLYCQLWPVWLYNILPRCLINCAIFEQKKVIEHKMCVLIFSTTFVSNISF